MAMHVHRAHGIVKAAAGKYRLRIANRAG